MLPFKKDKSEPKIEGVLTPSRIRRWVSSISGLTAFFAPDQEVANASAKEFATAHQKGPPFTPFATPKPHGRPWCVDLPSHERANKARKDPFPHKTKETPQKVSTRAWLLYVLRFVEAWSSFGRLSAQISLLSTPPPPGDN